MSLDFRKHNIIPTMEWNLFLADPRTIKKFNDNIHKIFVKHDIYQNIQYIYNLLIYPLPTHLARVFERLEKLITHLMHAADKNAEEK